MFIALVLTLAEIKLDAIFFENMGKWHATANDFATRRLDGGSWSAASYPVQLPVSLPTSGMGAIFGLSSYTTNVCPLDISLLVR